MRKPLIDVIRSVRSLNTKLKHLYPCASLIEIRTDAT